MVDWQWLWNFAEHSFNRAKHIAERSDAWITVFILIEYVGGAVWTLEVSGDGGTVLKKKVRACLLIKKLGAQDSIWRNVRDFTVSTFWVFRALYTSFMCNHTVICRVTEVCSGVLVYTCCRGVVLRSFLFLPSFYLYKSYPTLKSILLTSL